MTFHWSNPYEFGGTQGETEKEYEFVSTIFAFITLETTKMIRRILPGTDHLLSYEHPCDSKVASSHFTNYELPNQLFFEPKWRPQNLLFVQPAAPL